MEQQTLVNYLTKRVEAGATKDAVREQLLAVGWSEDEADAAYARALVASGVPVPEEGARGKYAKRTSTADMVINFFSFILLGINVIALGVLYFNVISRYFPDPLVDVYVSSAPIHYAIAALIIGFPLYYFSVRLWFKRFRDDEGKVESKLTKWLTYLLLLVASVTIVGDLITALYTFLQGELTVRFLLKALTILVIAGSVFGFYFLERRKVQYRQPIERRVFQYFGAGFGAVIVAGIVLGFTVTGSPATERMRGLDAQRVSDLEQIANCINNSAHQVESLPDTLEELQASTDSSWCADRRDPETGAVYEYRLIQQMAPAAGKRAEGEYELCAVFALEADGTESPASGYYYVSPGSKWGKHAAGRACDTEKVSIDLGVYPVPVEKF